jgi:ABC-type glycerol-3-phosphate transport system substrate-binding protein
MKKLLGLLLALSLLISVFSSCAPASAPYGDSAAASDELTLYITENETWWRAAVENFERENEDASVNLQTFASEEELAAKQNTEISTGGGPDVILDGRYASSPGDMRKMAQSGKFLALDSYFENDESFDESDYYAAVLDYGVYDGTRYTVTPAFGIPGIAAAESKIAEYPVLDGDYSMLELFTALADESEALSSDPNAFA